MKKTITSLLLLAGLCATAQVKIGDNPTTISPGAALEIESTNKGLVIPRVANTAAVTSPTNGMLVYDLSSNCVKFYENGVWSNCISTGTSSVVQGILAQIGLEADNPNVLPSTVTAVQLSQVGVTGVTPANIGAYQAYIDANPDNFSNPATVSEIQAAVTAVNATVTSVLAQIGNEADNPNSVTSVVTVEQLESVGITGVTEDNIGAYQAYIDANPDAFSNPATVSEIQTAVSNVNTAVSSVLTQIGNEGDSPNLIPSVVTVAQLNSIGVTGITASNIGAYQAYIDANPNSFSSPATVSEIQAAVNAVNTNVTSVLAQIGNEGDNPNSVTSVVTVAQLESIGVTGITASNIGAYQAYIDANPDAFSNPATLSEIQSAVSTVNTNVSSVLTQIGNEGDNPNTIPSSVTVAQLQSIGITGINASNLAAYQAYIDANPDNFSSPATLSEVQSAVTAVNSNVTSVLAQIGNEGDSPNTVPSVVTVAQLQSLGITGITADNIGAYQAYIDANPNSFSSPALLSEVQSAVTAVNSGVTSVLTQIGNEGDSPNTVPSVVTAAQLQSLGITGVTPANIVAYQAYIDANPNSFSSPATLSEVQSAVSAVNTSAATSGGTATVSGFVCNTASAGTLTKGTAASGVTQTITATVTTAGTYSITATANGVTFTGTGTFAGTGSQAIVLTASGTPTAAGSNSFTLSTTPGCSFTRSTIDAGSGGTAAVSSWDCTGTLTGVAAVGVPVSGLTKVVTATVSTAGSYSVSATANGITFSGSGTFSGTGSQAITLTATGTPTAAGTNSFTINSTPSCSFDVTTKTLTAVDYAFVMRSGSVQTITSANTDVVFDNKIAGNLPYNTSTGVFTLTAGKTYRLTSNLRMHTISSNTVDIYIDWVDASTNASISGNVGSAYQPLNSTNGQSAKTVSDILYTPASTQTVKLRVTYLDGASFAVGQWESSATVQELGMVQSGTTFAKVDYVATRQSANQTINSGTNDLILNTNTGGNIPYNTSTGVYTLTAGKTYHLYFEGRFTSWSATDAMNISWVDATTNTPIYDISARPQTNISTNGANSVCNVEFIYTPATNQSIKIRTALGSGTAILSSATGHIYQLGNSKTLSTVAYNTSNATGSISIPAAGVNLPMNNTLNGTITHNTTTGAYTLEAGKTYRMTFTGVFDFTGDPSGGSLGIYWVDSSTNTAVVGAGSFFVPTTNGGLRSSNNQLTAIYTPTVTQTVVPRVTYSASGAASLSGNNVDRVVIEELGVNAN
ncbi:beta strand repeat-containing protein [Flavobacterium sp. TBRC 19031]|uniref:beta strand repeat-containing protein n=1 Tax=Flavobacterium mekongense TaxID=3379707 RepID=UPI003999B875